MQRIPPSTLRALTSKRRNFTSFSRARIESVQPGQAAPPPSPKKGGNVLPLSIVALVIGGGGYYYYYTQGEHEHATTTAEQREKVQQIEHDAKSKANQLFDQAKARGEVGATEAREKVSGIVDQTRANWEQTKDKASEYASDAERKVYEIRDKASKTSKDEYYGKADALRGEAKEKAADVKSSWWSWLGWSSSKKDQVKEQWKPAMKKEWDEVKKGPKT